MNNHRRGRPVRFAALLAIAGCGGGTPQNRGTTTTKVRTDAGTWSLVPQGPNPLGRPMAWTGKELLVAQSACCDDLAARVHDGSQAC